METPHVRNVVESHPEFYADIIAAGGLAAAMAQCLQRLEVARLWRLEAARGQ